MKLNALVFSIAMMLSLPAAAQVNEDEYVLNLILNSSGYAELQQTLRLAIISPATAERVILYSVPEIAARPGGRTSLRFLLNSEVLRTAAISYFSEQPCDKNVTFNRNGNEGELNVRLFERGFVRAADLEPASNTLPFRNVLSGTKTFRIELPHGTYSEFIDVCARSSPTIDLPPPPENSSDVPDTPTGLIATPGDSEVEIAFTSGAANGSAITNYEYSLNGANYIALDPADSTSPITISGLNNGTDYSITLRAINSVGSSSPSAAVAVTPAAASGATAPDAPTNLSATPSDGEAEIAFTPGADNGSDITNYEYSIDGATYTTLNPADAESPVTIPNLTNGTEYSITLRALNSEGFGAASDAVLVTPQPDSDDDGILDTDDVFPEDPVETTDTDGDGIGDNGDAGGTGVGIRISGASTLSSCEFIGPVTRAADFLERAPGNPLGIQLTFALANCGASVDIEALFGEELPSGSVPYKVTSSGDWVAIEGATVSGNTIRYTVTDGGPLDEDGIANGFIIDPVTAVVPMASPPPTPVTTLPSFGLLAFGGLLGLFGLRQVKARREYR